VSAQRLLFLLAVAAAAAGCAGPPFTVYSPPPAVACRGVVLVADGAGNFQAASAALEKVAASAGLPLQVRPFVWSHGSPRALADHLDYEHARAEGRRLAAEVLTLRREWPGAEIHLVGHSAGCAVVVAAGDCLPPDGVDGAILLAPALSADYDLRPTLRAARQGLDVFYSEHDWFYLGVVTGLLGTSDRRWCAAGGRLGFRPHADTPADVALLARLRQHAWQPAFAAAGNLGGHYGCYQPAFLRTHVLPLLRGDGCAAGGP
jgi:pimeloyl-ACP methyl ester carboxylesterase